MRTPHLTLILILSIFFLFCREEIEEKTRSKPAGTTLTEKTALSARATISNYDSLLNILLPLANTVMQNPTNSSFAMELLDAAFHTEGGRFYCIGKGVVNPKHPAAAQQQGLKKAARHTGERWALYLKAWQSDSTLSFGTKLSGRLLHAGSVHVEKMMGDTLYQLLSVSADSVELLQ